MTTSSWSRLASLPFEISELRLGAQSVDVSSAFTRHSTTVRLIDGSGRIGRGEDVSYAARDQESLRALAPRLPLAGSWTLASFSEHLDGLALWEDEPSQAASRDYRRWAFESAALDLALRSAGTSLHAHLGRESRPLRYVVSTRLHEPETESLSALRAQYPGTRFKLDLEESWTPDFVRELRALDCVDTVDLKGMYEGTIVDLAPDAERYAMVAEGLPEAWIEDPRWNEATRPALADHLARVTWDAPIHSLADVDALRDAPRCLNSKPSRFGTLARLFEFYDACEERGIALYAGGQFELDVGRAQIQYLASIFHPDTPNDCAPRGFNVRPVPEGLPTSPMRVEVNFGAEA